MYDQLAKIALNLLARVQVAADDQTLEVTRQVRAMLHGIAKGELVVGKPVADPPSTEAT